MATSRLLCPSSKLNGPFPLSNSFPCNLEVGLPIVGFCVAHRITVSHSTSGSRFFHVSTSEDRRAVTGQVLAEHESVAEVTSDDVTVASMTPTAYVSTGDAPSSDLAEKSDAPEKRQNNFGFDVNAINFIVRKSVSAPASEVQSEAMPSANMSQTPPNAVPEGRETTATAVTAPVAETAAATLAATVASTVAEEVSGVKTKRIRGKKVKLHGEPQSDKFGRRRTKRAGRELAVALLYASETSNRTPLEVLAECMQEKTTEGGGGKRLDREGGGGGERERDGGGEAEAKNVPQDAYDERGGGWGSGMGISFRPAVRMTSASGADVTGVGGADVRRFAQVLLGNLGVRAGEMKLGVQRVIPPRWQADPAPHTLSLCVIKLAVSELQCKDTSAPTVVVEAVQIAKALCDPQVGPTDSIPSRVINGCLGTLIRSPMHKSLMAKSTTSSTDEEEALDLDGELMGWSAGYYD